jgi:predicted GIY-YIG superfamily endonuclease
MDYIVYILTNSKNRCTYIGITNNPIRRVRQHNGELVGGARYTTMRKGDGDWSIYGFIDGLDKRLALSIEKKIHIHSRKAKGDSPLDKRLNYINELLLQYENLKLTLVTPIILN